jgi:hypothetical protein
VKSPNSVGKTLVLLGTYSPSEAARLLPRFEQAGIVFAIISQAEGNNEAGPTITMEIRVDPTRSDEVDRIHRGLFGDLGPNYDSSFFRNRRNV